MDLVTGPGRCPLGCITCICIVGRTEVAARRREIIIVPIVQLSVPYRVVLNPNLA